MNLDARGAKLVLLCPAWKKWGTATTVKPGTVILHSEADDIVPIAHSRELVARSGLPDTALSSWVMTTAWLTPNPSPRCLRLSKA